jgi:hypothetical protein
VGKRHQKWDTKGILKTLKCSLEKSVAVKSASCEEGKELMACAILQEDRNTTGEANITPAKIYTICVGIEIYRYVSASWQDLL